MEFKTEVNHTGVLQNPAVHRQVFDVCIIGAGVGGAALASFLGRNGIRVALIEKSFAEQDRIVGELLQPGGVQKLHELGLSQCIEGIGAIPVHGYSIFRNGQAISIPYPKNQTGRGFRNGKFVQNLRNEAKKCPEVVFFEGTATELSKNADGIIDGATYIERSTGEEQSIRSKLTVVSDGFFSIFRKSLSRNKPTVSGFFLGIILKNAELPNPDNGHVFLTDNSPFIAYPVNGNEIRVLIDFPGSMPPKKSEQLKLELKAKVIPYLPNSLHQAFYEALDEGDFKVMPNHYMPAKPNIQDGAVLLGDALNMRHPLTGGGMTATFTDVLALGNLILKNEAPQREIIKQYYSAKRTDNSSINILADALYRVFKKPALAEACFKYLAQGGKFSEEPVSILSGISRDKKLLIHHFFAVAIYGAKNNFKQNKSLLSAYDMVRSAFGIVHPLIQNEKPSLRERIILTIGLILFPINDK